MGFREHLEKICSSVDGAIAASVMGFDGMAIDTHEVAQAEGIDLPSLLVEYANILNQVRSAAGLLQSGGIRELILSTDKVTTVSRLVGTDYFVVLALAPEGNLGKARFVLRLAVPEVAREF